MRKPKAAKLNAKILQQLIHEDLNLKSTPELKFHPSRKWRIDLAIESLKIAIEFEGGIYSGGRHTRPTGFLGDIEKYNNLTLYGWKLLRYTHTNHSYSHILQDLEIFIENNLK